MQGKKKSTTKVEVICAKVNDNARSYANQLPIEMLTDLHDCFKHYDTENTGLINDTLFKNILQNFGFHKMGPRDIEEELKKSDTDIAKRNAFNLKFCEHVIAYHWFKGLKEPGKDAEA